jgi:hypothetical protein
MAEKVDVQQVSERVPIGSGRYEILPGNPLPAYDQPGAKAYAVHTSRGGATLVGLVPDEGEFPRHDAMPSAANVNSINVFRFLECDVALWPQTNRYRPIVVIEKPPGTRIMTSLSGGVRSGSG